MPGHGIESEDESFALVRRDNDSKFSHFSLPTLSCHNNCKSSETISQGSSSTLSSTLPSSELSTYPPSSPTTSPSSAQTGSSASDSPPPSITDASPQSNSTPENASSAASATLSPSANTSPFFIQPSLSAKSFTTTSSHSLTRAVPFSTTTSLTHPTASHSLRDAIIGGVLGSCGLVVLVCALIWWCKRPRRVAPSTAFLRSMGVDESPQEGELGVIPAKLQALAFSGVDNTTAQSLKLHWWSNPLYQNPPSYRSLSIGPLLKSKSHVQAS
ncbi:hypothetical protein EIP91_010414 [Steccherinum ochraceum]|uniref:Mid2 domain-containing protein n=1 Tax=Steccherinum ochraceum TaxID=92696 RepID=A0A4R0R383_9APHY|nr:hypothetical protein EIP91_010414 [Steccherinum ochraceum]